MLSVALAFVGALVYGAGDFLGGLASRRLPAIVVSSVAAFAGMVVLLALVPFAGGHPTGADLLWGAASGVAGAVAIARLYGCLAIGPMSVLSPVTAVVSAVSPILWAVLVDGTRLGPWAIAGIALAAVAIVLVALLPGERIVRPSARGLAMAVGSGVAIGAFLIILDRIGADAGLLPIVLGRAVNGTVAAIAAAVILLPALRGRVPEVARDARRWMLALACGVVDGSANLLLLAALRADGELAVVSALTALYPAGTILLAALVLRERITPLQWAGLALALAASAALALG